MGGIINWMAYMWLITSETLEELFFGNVGDFLRRFTYAAETREKAPRVESRTLPHQKPLSNATNTV